MNSELNKLADHAEEKDMKLSYSNDKKEELNTVEVTPSTQWRDKEKLRQLQPETQTEIQ